MPLLTSDIDSIIKDGSLNTQNISFSRLFELLNSNVNLHGELERGRKILTSNEELAQYWYSYSRLIKEQWDAFWKISNPYTPPRDLEIIDYGCGQGLACCLLFDRHGDHLGRHLKQVTLIEPSKKALYVAQQIIQLYLKKFGKETSLKIINKFIGQTRPNQLIQNNGLAKLHLFSNVLDIQTWDHKSYFQELFSIKGMQSFLCISPYREFDGGEERFRNVLEVFNMHARQNGHTTVQDPMRFIYREWQRKEAIALNLNLSA